MLLLGNIGREYKRQEYFSVEKIGTYEELCHIVVEPLGLP